jgi:ribosomal protein S18 acetylase RimI-like enzyme
VSLRLPAPLRLRESTPDDLEFLQRVYFSTRWEELEITGWNQAQKLGFLHMQFHAQDTHYRAHYPGAEFLVVLRGDEPIGRIYLYATPTELRIMDIALLPEHRGHGHGRALMQAALHEARADNKIVTLHVEHHNPARSWYERLGFEALEDTGVYLYMRWTPLS